MPDDPGERALDQGPERPFCDAISADERAGHGNQTGAVEQVGLALLRWVVSRRAKTGIDGHQPDRQVPSLANPARTVSRGVCDVQVGLHAQPSLWHLDRIRQRCVAIDVADGGSTRLTPAAGLAGSMPAKVFGSSAKTLG